VASNVVGIQYLNQNKNPPRGRVSALAGRLGLFGPSMSQTPALRGPACGCPCRSRRLVDCSGRMPKRTSAQPMARRARHRKCRVTWLVSAVPQPKIKNPPRGRVSALAGRLGLFGPSMGLTPLRGASLRLSKIVPDDFVERAPPPVPQPKIKNPPQGRVFYFGWETRIRLVRSQAPRIKGLRSSHVSRCEQSGSIVGAFQ